MHGGVGEGDGPFAGDGVGGVPLNPTVARQQRWRMIFNTNNGNDYLRQLAALGAIVRADKDGKAYFIHNLNERPAKPQVEDPAAINCLHWIDDDPASVESVVEALRFSWKPDKIYVYFPESLETTLVKKELEYGRPQGRKSEQDIGETRFKIEFSRGAPVITVVYQEGKK
jgi:hypothetical protein